jgi:DNA polymerase V
MGCGNAASTQAISSWSQLTRPPVTGKVCVAFLHGEVVLAILAEKDGEWWLEPSNYAPQPLDGDTEVWAMIAALVRTDV